MKVSLSEKEKKRIDKIISYKKSDKFLTMSKIIENANKIRKQNGNSGMFQRFGHYGFVAIPEFYEVYIEFLEEKFLKIT